MLCLRSGDFPMQAEIFCWFRSALWVSAADTCCTPLRLCLRQWLWDRALILRPNLLQPSPETFCVASCALTSLTPGSGETPEFHPSRQGKDGPGHQHPEGFAHHAAYFLLPSRLVSDPF